MKHLFFILFSFFLICSVRAIPTPLSGQLFSVEKGASLTRISVIVQDRQGFLWIGTDDGLNRFDGVHFTVFRNQPYDTTSLCDNNIRSIFVDKKDNLWIGTSGGLSYFDKQTGKFNNFKNDSNNPFSISSNDVVSISGDDDGVIWVQTQQSLEKLDLKTHRFYHYYYFTNVFHQTLSGVCSGVLPDNKGSIWVATKDGLNRFDKTDEIFERFYKNGLPESVSDDNIYSLYFDRKDELWVLNSKGLELFSYSKQRFFQVPLDKGQSKITDVYYSMTQDKSGHFWIGSQSGLIFMDGQTKQSQRLHNIFLGNSSQPLDEIYVVFCDRSNILWLATSLGLVKVDLKPKKFGLYRQFGAESLSNVLSVYADDSLAILGRGEQGISFISRRKATIKTFTTQELSRVGITEKSIMAIFRDSRNNIYMGTNNGAFRKIGSKWESICAKMPDKTCSNLYSHRIYQFVEDEKNRVLIATDHGIHIYDPQMDTITSVRNVNSKDGRYKIGQVNSLVPDSGGLVWLGTAKGLVKLNLTTYYADVYSKLSLQFGNDQIMSMLMQSPGILWLGTSSGLVKFFCTTGNYSTYTEKDGLPSNRISSILNDNHGNLWFTTSDGIVKFDQRRNFFALFDLTDGLQSYRFNSGATYKTKSGELFFGGISGVNYFFPDSIEYNNVEPVTVISSYSIVYKGGETTQIISHNPNAEIEVPYSANAINIEFAALDFTSPDKNHFVYRLLSSDTETEWIDIGTRTFVSFSNLLPGTYIFQVKGSNSDLIYSNVAATITLVINPPFWMSKTAIVFYLVLIVLIVYLVLQLRTYSLRQANRRLREKELASRKIARQREELAAQNKNIKDSINYAKRLQLAMMPSERIFKRLISNSFVFYKPKDIVSGDFFWIKQVNGVLKLAAVDCTGHGVPGAFMSVIGYELFRRVSGGVACADRPADMLNDLMSEFANVFGDVEDSRVHDGMDVALCTIDLNTHKMQFSGAYNPLYIIRDNQIIEVPGDRFSVSIQYGDQPRSFTNHEIEIQSGDVFYMFSDGFPDQFGGPEGKKFKYKRFKHLLLSIHKLPFDEQKVYLNNSLEVWRGSLDQVDDILIIGFKIK